MINHALIVFGKLFSSLLKTFNLGNGSTWPGHIALKINSHFISDLVKDSQIKIILIAGTNGKTTTATLIRTALEKAGKKVMQNESGANLLNGIASTLLLQTTPTGKLSYDYAIFEVDENALPKVLSEIQPDYLVLLNLFRDQLDRYGEVNTIVANWKKAIERLSKKTTLVLNADDPQIAYLGLSSWKEAKPTDRISHKKDSIAALQNDNILYFGLQPSQFSTKTIEHAADSVSCPKCGKKLIFDQIAFSHLGEWRCTHCKLHRPAVEKTSWTVYPLPGLYNKYNVLAAVLVLHLSGVTRQTLEDAFLSFTPAFGRQEVITYKNKNLQLFLSKNPTSFNQSYETIKELGAKYLLIVLNDRIPDGRDVSWIWDVDFPNIQRFNKIFVAGDRAVDMGLRIKYEEYNNYQIFDDLEQAIEVGVASLTEDETLYILPTYSAMLEVRKILTGKKIL